MCLYIGYVLEVVAILSVKIVGITITFDFSCYLSFVFVFLFYCVNAELIHIIHF